MARIIHNPLVIEDAEGEEHFIFQGKRETPSYKDETKLDAAVNGMAAISKNVTNIGRQLEDFEKRVDDFSMQVDKIKKRVQNFHWNYKERMKP